ncbi:HpaII family restriction endonuclease [Flavobacterium sp.]|uniref:HpaII family restriction endonuclease n=1 Tax=Flavobacterium sp. TaxID=239 RepID=UPI0026373B61|nr:HpaII family restriction endonuclease [Flavobacterium sp.]
MICERVKFKYLKQSESLLSTKQSKFVFEVTGSDLIFKNVVFHKIIGEVFLSNLILIDSKLPELLSYIVKFQHFGKHTSLKSIVEELISLNPLNLEKDFKKLYYTYKVKSLLDHLARGMNELEAWNDNRNLHEYYPVMKIGNELIFYGENIDRFLDKLFNSCIVITTTEIFSKKIRISLELKIGHQI